jgi:hypothetical protein
MKTFVFAVALAATAVAKPTEQKRASKITPVTVKGNGMSLMVNSNMAAVTDLT